MKKYNVLVLEDTQKHIESARLQLENAPEVETLTIIGGSWRIEDQHQRFVKEISKADVVLTDLNFNCVSYGNLPGGDQKIGALIALVSLKNCVPYVGIVTDTKAHGDTFVVGLQLAFNARTTHNKGYSNGSTILALSTAVDGEKDWIGALRNLIEGESVDMVSCRQKSKQS
jgi:hypothetical protein